MDKQEFTELKETHVPYVVTMTVLAVMEADIETMFEEIQEEVITGVYADVEWTGKPQILDMWSRSGRVAGKLDLEEAWEVVEKSLVEDV